MVESKDNPWYYRALEGATYSVVDSGLFALLCKLHGIGIHKYSGYRLISDLLAHLKQQHRKVFVVSPRESESANIRQLLLSSTQCRASDLAFYNAPLYPAGGKVEDPALAAQITAFGPDVVLLCVAGGKQEILGHYLLEQGCRQSTILCTGAAISFFTGTQAKIPPLVDKLYLGWLARIIAQPKIFVPRYLNAFKYLPWFWKFRSTLRTEED